LIFFSVEKRSQLLSNLIETRQPPGAYWSQLLESPLKTVHSCCIHESLSVTAMSLEVIQGHKHCTLYGVRQTSLLIVLEWFSTQHIQEPLPVDFGYR